MASTSTTERAAEILGLCREAGEIPDTLWQPLADDAASDSPSAPAASQALFGAVAEPLGDSFEPAHCEAYARLFSRVIARVWPEASPDELLERYRRVRLPRHYEGATSAPENIVVLSRVTLGADVAVTSIVLDAVKRRFPSAGIYLAGPQKCWELFAGDTRIRHLPVAYPRRGTLRERLEAGDSLRASLADIGGIVVDPDSRLTQLGLLEVCDESRYFFFESRGYGGENKDSLGQLAKRWVAASFGVVDALPYIAPEPPPATAELPGITVSLGVGENPDKRLADPFEEELVRELVGSGRPVLIDKGAGGEEASRVDRAIARSGAKPGQIDTWDGAFAPFAARIQRSQLYVGYDSAGQHVAAASRTPFVSIFSGFPSERFFHRWFPDSLGRYHVLRFPDPQPAHATETVVGAIKSLLENA